MSKIPLTCSKVRGGFSQHSELVSSIVYKRNQKIGPSYNIKTNGEQFYVYLKELGYEFPSKLRPEHLEYAFNDESSHTAKLCKELMKKVKKKHALDPEEVRR